MSKKTRPFLPLLPLFALLLLLMPVLSGVAGVVLGSFGYFPALGKTELGLAPFRELFSEPGIGLSIWLSVSTGLLATVLAFAITMLVLAAGSGRRRFDNFHALLAPLLSVPHAAAAFGLAFLIAPSGWIARLFSPWLTGWDRPPDLLILNDPQGLSMVAALVVKEVPFLLLVSLAALGQVKNRRSLTVANALGYGRLIGWFKTVLPLVYAQIRLPVYVVLAYSMSVVDVAIILGPNTPPPLAVQVVRWMSDPDLLMRTQAAAGAVVQILLVAAALVVWRIAERLFSRLLLRSIWLGTRGVILDVLVVPINALKGLVVLAILFSLLTLGIWSVAGFWSFPDALPEGANLLTWMRHARGIGDAVATTALVGFFATIGGLVLVIGCLEAETRYGLKMSRRALLLLYLPLLVPQIAFLPGLQFLLLRVGADSGLVPVIFSHLIFVFPYVFLTLADPWRAWDLRYAQAGAAMGASVERVLWHIRLPMLMRPLLGAFAIGFAVSVGQYLPTLLIGGGRVETLTTEALALSSGGDRRAIGAYGLMQTAAALLPFLLATGLPSVVWRKRRGMLHG